MAASTDHIQEIRQRPPVDYLRISITDRCNYRCVYCVPPGGFKNKRHDEILRYEEIIHFTEVAAGLGFSRVRVTGGEPLVRRDCAGLVAGLAAVPGINEVSMTTNGSLLAAHAQELKDAGLDRVNISIDSFKEGRHGAVSGGARLEPVLAGLEAALAAGLTPVKVNTVILDGLDRELKHLIGLVQKYQLHIRFIELMPVNGAADRKDFMTSGWLRGELSRRVELKPVAAPEGAGPARYYRFDGAAGSFGFINLGDHFCHRCNRLRLTADGKLRDCLFGPAEMDIRPLLHGPTAELRRSILEVVAGKKNDWQLHRQGCNHQQTDWLRSMAQIGG